MTNWNDLRRTDQRTLQRLYGGGSLRNCAPDTILRLQQLGLIEGKVGRERLSPLGSALLDYTHANLTDRLGTRANG